MSQIQSGWYLAILTVGMNRAAFELDYSIYFNGPAAASQQHSKSITQAPQLKASETFSGYPFCINQCIKMEGAFGAGKAGTDFNPVEFVQRPQVILRLLNIVSLFKELIFFCK
jgi:hypothetical protein